MGHAILSCMQIQLILREQQHQQRWKNGGGSTREIARAGSESNFDWRASLAQIDASGPFSAFPGCQRWCCLVDGGPLTLIAEDAPSITLEPRLRAFSYSGEESRSGLLLGTHAQVFNLIVATDRIHAELIPRPLVGPMMLFCMARSSWLIYLSSGSAQLRVGEQHWLLGSGDAVIIEADEHTSRAVLDGGGEVILAKLEPRQFC